MWPSSCISVAASARNLWQMLLMIRFISTDVCLTCSALLVKVIFVITVFFLFLLCVSTILVNKDDHNVNNTLRRNFQHNLTSATSSGSQ